MGTRVKGAVIAARRAFVCKLYGEEIWTEVLAGLSAEHRQLLDNLVLATSWLPFALNEELDAAIVKVVGQGDPGIFKQIGAHSAKENLGGPHRDFLTPGNPQEFLAKTGRIYKFYYDQGRREYEATGLSSGVMTTYDAETYSQADCLTVIGWYEEALKLCGAKAVEMVEEECRATGGECCRYRLSWSM